MNTQTGRSPTLLRVRRMNWSKIIPIKTQYIFLAIFLMRAISGFYQSKIISSLIEASVVAMFVIVVLVKNIPVKLAPSATAITSLSDLFRRRPIRYGLSKVRLNAIVF